MSDETRQEISGETRLVDMQRDEIEKLRDEVAILQEAFDSVHPRVWKLVRRKRKFIVIGEHESYYMDAYDMIRKHEMSKGTWTEADNAAYTVARLAH